MNSFLLSVGVVIVLALFAALIGPFFVDWNGYRGVFEARLTEIAGRPVTIGRVDEFSILPNPVFKASNVSIGSSMGLRSGGEERAQPFLSAPQLTARMALTPLLSGEFRIEDVLIEKPVLSVTLDADGRAVLPPPPEGEALDPERVSLNSLEIRDGTLTLFDSKTGVTRRMSEINLAGQATTLAGPFRAEGGLVADGTLYNFRLGTGRVAGDAMRTKLALNPAGGRYALALDGQVTAAGGRPSFYGEMRIDHTAPPASAVGDSALRSEIAFPWRLNAALSLDPEFLRLDKLILGVGHESRSVQLTGEAAIALKPGSRLALTLNTRQIDLDRALGAQPGATVAIDDAASSLPGLLSAAAKLPAPVDISLTADAVLVNGALVEDVALDAAFDDGTLDVSQLRALLPGHARADWSGTVRTGDDGTSAAGDISLNVRQAGRLAEWLGRSGVEFGPLRMRADNSALALKARLETTAKDIVLKNLEARLDDALVTGTIGYRRGEARALRLALDADTLDLDRYFEIAPPRAGGKPKDDAASAGIPGISVDIKAGDVRVGGIAMRGVDADFTYEDGNLSINRLQIGDAGGASLDASGRIDDLFGRADGEIAANLSAEDLVGLVGLADELGVLGSAQDIVAPRAAALSPAGAKLTLRAERTGTGSDMSASLNGAFGGTQLNVGASFAGTLAEWRAGDLSVTVTGDNESSRTLLTQLSGRSIDVGEDGKGGIEARLEGVPEQGAALVLRAALFDGDGSADGTLTLGEKSAFDGKVRFAARSARAMAALLELPAGVQSLAAPVRFEAAVAGSGSSWAASGITGAAAGGGFDGKAEVTLPDDGPLNASATLGIDQLDATWLLALLLGEESSLAAEDGWPRAPFTLRAPGGAEAVVTLDAKRLDLPGGAAASDAHLSIEVAPGRVAITGARARLFGGAVKTNAVFKGGEGGVSATMNVALDGAEVQRMVWSLDGGQTAATGAFDLSAQVSGSGRSWLGLVSSLDGDGRFVARDGMIRGLSPEAFPRTLDAASSGLEIAEPKVAEAFSAYLAAEPLGYKRFEGEFTIEDGILSARNIALDAPGANARVSALIDLPGRKIDSEWLVSPESSNETDKQVPPVALVFAGPLAHPERNLDVHALTGFLTVRRLEADLERLEDAQADALEREFFDRRLDILRRAHMERVREQREKARAEAEARARDEERQRLEAEARERERQETEIRQQEQVDERGRPTGQGEPAQPGPGAGAQTDQPRDEEETASTEPAGEDETPAEADSRRQALERLIEEALGNSSNRGATGDAAPPREGGIVREELPPVPRASVPDTGRGDQPAPQQQGGPTQREAAAAPHERDDADAVPPVAPVPPPQRSIELEFDPLGSSR